ncbi:MAG: DUF4384 domain-containing protein [Candidatus Krumholzibacteriota bacterium]|nr:DUF4384 domain-containing protein [Candidatus Krumholzibacteriota bacterium]
MNRKLLLFLLAFVFIPLTVLDASPVEVTRALSGSQTAVRGDVDVSIRLVGGKGSVLREGRDINLTFRTSRDAYVIIYNIDSEGLVQLLYPENGKLLKTKGEEVYFLPDKDKGLSWEVRGETGIEYIHAIAVTNGDRINIEELQYLAANRDLQGGEQLRVDIDPYLAFNMIDELLIADADNIAPASDFTYFFINQEVDYPRYLCASCHGEGRIEDPYAVECPEVVIEKMLYEEDPVYPYPALFSVQHVDDTGGDGYASEYYEDNLSGGLGGYDSYDDDKVYLSIYYTDYDYPYSFYYPTFRTWNTYYYDPWGWDYYDPWYDGFYFTVGWNDYYYHHWPFYTWYDYRYDYYAWSVNYRYYDGFLDYYCYNDYYTRDRRSIYSGRDFKKRSIDYAMVTRTNDRTRTLHDSKVSRTKSLSPDARIPSSALRDKTIRDKTAVSSTRDALSPNIRTGSTVYDRNVKREVIHGDASKVRTGDPRTTRTTRRTYSPSKGTTTRRSSEDKKTPLNYNNSRTTTDRRSNGADTRKSSSSRSSTSRERTRSSSTSKSSTSVKKSSTTSKSRSSSTKKADKPDSKSSAGRSSTSRSVSRSSSSASSSRSSSGGSASRSSSSGSSSRSSSGRKK